MDKSRVYFSARSRDENLERESRELARGTVLDGEACLEFGAGLIGFGARGIGRGVEPREILVIARDGLQVRLFVVKNRPVLGLDVGPVAQGCFF